MNGVFFVCVLSCHRLESDASIVHFAALLFISSFKSSVSVCTAQGCLLETMLVDRSVGASLARQAGPS